jgi:uncharacterized membrane protein YciS (DUF1049 family)
VTDEAISNFGDGIQASATRVPNETRVAVLVAVLFSVGLAIALALQAEWWIRVVSGMGGMVAAVLVLRLIFRCSPVTQRVMSLMHWITGA